MIHNCYQIERIMLFKNICRFSSSNTFDYLIVGGGTAGCLLANRLSANPDIKVALFQAGSKDNYLRTKVPIGYLYCFGNPKVDWCFKTSNQPGLVGRSIRYPRGKVMGGSSSINGMIYMRGQSRDYDIWSQDLNDPQWAWEKCLPYFLKHEDYHGGDNQFHRKGGQWKVSTQRVSYDLLDKIQDAFQQRKVPKTNDFNQGNNFGCGYYDVNQNVGVRWNTATGFINPVINRPNLKIFTNHDVNKLLISNGKVKGIEAIHNNQNLKFYSKETILSAGSIGSPCILQRSGIGGKWLEDQKLVKLEHELPGVGENLQDHLQLRLIFKLNNIVTLNTLTKMWIQKVKMGLKYLWNRSGPLSMSPSQLGAFVHSQKQPNWPAFQYHIQALSLDAFGQPLHDFDAATLSICYLRPKSKGSIRIVSNDYKKYPILAMNYLTHKQDQQRALQAIRITRDIAKTNVLQRYQPKEFLPGDEYQSDEQLIKQAGRIGTTIFHPVGTCKMGISSDQSAVVDSRLRMRGLENIRIVDASVMPKIVSGNTNSPTLMIAQKAAQWILKS